LFLLMKNFFVFWMNFNQGLKTLKNKSDENFAFIWFFPHFIYCH
jgi:hypothetical protein